MKRLKMIRIAVSVLFLVASILYAVVGSPAVASLVADVQISLSLLSVSIGVTLFWVVATFFLGRVYCSSVCPLGTLIDGIIRLTRPGRARRSFAYRHARRFRFDVVLIYAVGIVFGIGVTTIMLEPWQVFRNLVGVWYPSQGEAIALHLGVGTVTGLICGIVSLLTIVITAYLHGRMWCNEICPIGICLSAVASRSQMRIEIDPDKCINCMKCEEGCKSECIKVVSRYVDNSRCVRCFSCISSCPNDAIRYQSGRNRVSTPMMKRVDSPS